MEPSNSTVTNLESNPHLSDQPNSYEPPESSTEEEQTAQEPAENLPPATKESATTTTPGNNTPDDLLIRKQVRQRYSRADYLIGRSIIEDELLIIRQRKARNVGERAKHKFEEALTMKIHRVTDKKIHNAFVHFMTTICFAISMTSVLEFPYMCYIHGGATFLLPYGIILLFVGAPLMFVEMGLGQFCPLPTGTLFKAINLTYVGIGKAMLFVAFWRLLWNAERVVHAIYIAALAVPPIFTDKSPWTGCNVTSNVNSDKCFDYTKFNQNVCNDTNSVSKECIEYQNVIKGNLLTPTFQLTPMFLDYIKTQVLPQAFQIHRLEFSPYSVNITLCVFWIFVCALAILGIRRSATPLIIAKCYAFIFYATFTVVAYNAKGAKLGQKLFLTYNSDHLWDGACWADAVKHVILSIGLCEGTIHKLGSLSHFNTRFYKSVIGTVVFSFLFSFASAIMFFSCIASVAAAMFTHELNDDMLLARIHEFMGQGKIMLFTAFPEYIISTRTNVSYLSIMLYYLSIALIALPSVVMNLNKIFAAYQYSYLFRWIWKKWPGHPLKKHILISSAISALIFPCVFLVVQPWGQVIKQLIKHSLVNALFIIGTVEILIVAYAYNAHRFIVDINSMHRSILIATSCYLSFCYHFSTPFLLAAGCIYHFGFNQKLRVIDYVIPPNLIIFSIATFLLAIGPIFYYIIKRMILMIKSHLSLRAIFQLTPYWIPPNKEDAMAARAGRLAHRAQTIYTKVRIDGEHYFLDCRRQAEKKTPEILSQKDQK